MTRKKLLVLDVNGLLVDTYFVNKQLPNDSPDAKIGRFFVYKRPFCGEFLQFCLENFIVGVWSSAREHNVNNLVDYVFGEAKQYLAFCWHQFDCTDVGLKSPDNKFKPLFLKELSKLWGNVKSNLPWKEGDYGPSNTLLIDDTPYKALLNPPYTGIFPQTFCAKDSGDDFLGSVLQKYLEGIRDAKSVQSHVKSNPIGEPSITSESPLWKIVNDLVSRVEDAARKDEITCKIEGVVKKDGEVETNARDIDEKIEVMNIEREDGDKQNVDDAAAKDTESESKDWDVNQKKKCNSSNSNHPDRIDEDCLSDELDEVGDVSVCGLEPGAKWKHRFYGDGGDKVEVKHEARTDGVMPKENATRKDDKQETNYQDIINEKRWHKMRKDINKKRWHKRQHSYFHSNFPEKMNEKHDKALRLNQEEENYDNKQNKSSDKRHKKHGHEVIVNGAIVISSDLDQQNYRLQPEAKQKQNFCTEETEIGVHEHYDDEKVKNKAHNLKSENKGNLMGINTEYSKQRHQRYSYGNHDSQEMSYSEISNYNLNISNMNPDRRQGGYKRHDFEQHMPMGHYDWRYSGHRQNVKRRWQWHRSEVNEVPYDDHSCGTSVNKKHNYPTNGMTSDNSYGSSVKKHNYEHWIEMPYGDYSQVSSASKNHNYEHGIQEMPYGDHSRVSSVNKNHNYEHRIQEMPYGDHSRVSSVNKNHNYEHQIQEMQYGDHLWGSSANKKHSYDHRINQMSYDDHSCGSSVNTKHNYKHHGRMGYYDHNINSWEGDSLRFYEMQYDHSWGRSSSRTFEDRSAVKSRYKWERKHTNP